MASEFRRRTLLTWGAIGAAGVGLKRLTRTSADEARAKAEALGAPWHGEELNAFAVSPDGRFVATGAASSSVSDQREGVVLWNVDAAKPVWRAGLLGGVMRVDEPFAALSFAPDGSQLAARTRTNEVVVLDVATGQVLGRHGLRAIEAAPSFFFSQKGEQLFVADTSSPGTIGAIVSAHGSEAGRPVIFDDAAVLPFRLDERGLHVLSLGEYRLLADRQPPNTVTTLMTAWPSGVAVDGARRHLAIASSRRLALVDLETGQTRFSEGVSATELTMTASGAPLGFAHDGIRWHVYRYSDELAESALFDSTGKITGALSPDGKHALELTDDWELISWRLGHTAKQVGSLGVFIAASRVAWPRDGRAVVFGPKTLAFCDPLTRKTVERFAFAS